MLSLASLRIILTTKYSKGIIPTFFSNYVIIYLFKNFVFSVHNTLFDLCNIVSPGKNVI